MIAEDPNLAAKSRFVRRASHDLRQPLAALQLLLFELSHQEEDARKHELLQVIKSSVAMMQDFVNQLIDHERYAAKLVETAPRRFMLGPLLQGLEDSLRPLAEGGRCRLKLMNCGLAVMGDPVLLGDCLRHLVDNAVKYGGSGAKVLVGCRRRDGRVAIEVWDNGPGIPEAEQEAVFQPFYQCGQVGSPGSLGLGLTIAAAIAKAMGEALELRSTPGGPTVFRLCLPVARQLDQAPEPEETQGPQGPFSGLSVLLTGTDGEAVGRVKTLMTKWGAQVWDVGEKATAESLQRHALAPDLLMIVGALPADVDATALSARLEKLFGKSCRQVFVTPKRPMEEMAKDCYHLPLPLKPARLRSLIAHLEPRAGVALDG